MYLETIIRRTEYSAVPFLVLLLLALLLMPGVSAQNMMYRYDAGHSGDYSPVAGVTGSNVSLLWNKTMENTAWGRSVPAVANGTIYITNTIGNFYALNAATGREQWKVLILIQQSSPAVVNDTVYVGSEDGNVYALNAVNGDPIWTDSTGGPIVSSPNLANGTVYITSNNKRGDTPSDEVLYALDATTGEHLWNFTIGGYSDSSPAVADDTVFVSGEGGRVYAVRADTGAGVWNATVGSDGGYVFTPSPLIKRGIVYAGSNEGNNVEKALTFNVYALNATTGARIWNFTISGHISSEPALSQNILYINSDSYLYALNASTGSVLWTANPTGTVIVAKDILYLCNYGGISAIDPANGTPLWSLNLPVESFLWKSTTAVIENDRFYEVNYGSNAGNPAGGPSIDKITIYALDLNAGTSGVPISSLTPATPAPLTTASVSPDSGIILLIVVFAFFVYIRHNRR
jgi:outer membrane protein assembly factor BamB